MWIYEQLDWFWISVYVGTNVNVYLRTAQQEKIGKKKENNCGFENDC